MPSLSLKWFSVDKCPGQNHGEKCKESDPGWTVLPMACIAEEIHW